jgi:hypothetical protein
VLGGVDPSKATVEHAPTLRAAFDAVVATNATRADDDTTAVAIARDADVGVALAGGRRVGGAKPKKLVGRALYMDRKQNGFKDETASE